MSMPGALFASSSRRRRRTARRLQAGTLAILVSYVLLGIPEGWWALPIFWTLILVPWLAFFKQTRCGVKTSRGDLCGNVAHGRLRACHLVKHRHAKNDALRAMFKLRHPAVGLSQRRDRSVAPSATRLLTAAVRLLPAAERARYAGEYRSELWELARAGDGRVGQLCYALRQVRNAPSMGRVLRSPHRRSASP
jgi:hypothetical protein